MLKFVQKSNGERFTFPNDMSVYKSGDTLTIRNSNVPRSSFKAISEKMAGFLGTELSESFVGYTMKLNEDAKVITLRGHY